MGNMTYQQPSHQGPWGSGQAQVSNSNTNKPFK
jgi:hypothetical protein